MEGQTLLVHLITTTRRIFQRFINKASTFKFLLLACVTSWSSILVKGETNHQALYKTDIKCHMDIGVGICQDLPNCPAEQDPFLAKFPIFCKLEDGRRGVCCPKKGEVPVPVAHGQRCTFNSTRKNGICRDIGDCPALDHLLSLKDYVFCDRPTATICCPDGGTPEEALSPKELKAGDVCTLPEGQFGICVQGLSCAKDGTRPFASPEMTYCDQDGGLICCPKEELTSQFKRGDACSLTDNERGTCWGISECAKTQNVTALTNIKYCHEPSLLVCCLTPQEKETDVVQISPPRTNFACGNSYPEPVLRRGRIRRPRYLDGSFRKTRQPDFYGDRTSFSRDVLRNVSVKFMALIGMKDGDYINWICNGALINKQWVLTAAHCFLIRWGTGRSDFYNHRNQLWSSVVVRLGEYDFRDEYDLASHKDIGVEEVVPFPDYVLYKGYHDLALIKLTYRALLGRYINPACLPWGPLGQQDLEDRPVIQTGWGASWPDGAYLSHLYTTALKVYPLQECNYIYSQKEDYDLLFPNGMGEDTLCAGDPHGDGNVCQGNFGGALVYLDAKNRHTLVGIEFRSFSCDARRDPGLFVNLRMTPYLSWIRTVAFKDDLGPFL